MTPVVRSQRLEAVGLAVELDRAGILGVSGTEDEYQDRDERECKGTQ
jgi:hypothetical protein